MFNCLSVCMIAAALGALGVEAAVRGAVRANIQPISPRAATEAREIRNKPGELVRRMVGSPFKLRRTSPVIIHTAEDRQRLEQHLRDERGRLERRPQTQGQPRPRSGPQLTHLLFRQGSTGPVHRLQMTASGRFESWPDRHHAQHPAERGPKARQLRTTSRYWGDVIRGRERASYRHSRHVARPPPSAGSPAWARPPPDRENDPEWSRRVEAERNQATIHRSSSSPSEQRG